MSTTAASPDGATRGAIRRPATDGYDAFISYSQAADGKLAPRLEEGLERLAKPLLRPRALNVFRDGTGLSATPELWPTIQRAIDASRYFILMASPGAVASTWVNAEVNHWLTDSPAAKEGKAAERLLIVLSAGDLRWDAAAGGFDLDASTALPPGLHHGVFRHEPLWVDLRGAHTQEDLSLQNAYFRGKVADLAAPLHNKSKDELIGEDVRIARRNRRLAWSASTLLAVLAVAASLAAVVAVRQGAQATSRALAAAAVEQLDLNPRASLDSAARAVATAPTHEAVTALRRALIHSSLIAELVADSGMIESAVFSPRGDRIVARVALPGGRGYLQTWDAAGARGCIIPGAGLRRFTSDWAGVVTADGRVLNVRTCAPMVGDTAEAVLTPALTVVGGPLDPEQSIRDARTGAEVVKIPLESIDPVAGVVPSPDGRQAVTWAVKGLYSESGGGASESGERFARVWTLQGFDNTRPDLAPAGHLLSGHRRMINTAAFGANAIATGSDDRTVRIWTRRLGRDDWQEAAVLAGHRTAVIAVALSPDDGRVVSVDEGGTARIWQTGTGTASLSDPAAVFEQGYGRSFPAPRGLQPVGMPVLTRNGRRVAAAVGELRVAVWDTATGAPVGPPLELRRYFPSGPPAGVEDLAERLSPDGARILVPLGNRNVFSSDDSVALVVEVATGAVVDTLYGHRGPVYAAAWSPDGSRIVTGGEDGTVRLWDGQSYSAGRVLQLPDTRVLHVNFSPDGERVLVSSRDALAQIWNPTSGALLELFGHEDGIQQAFFSPGGELVVSVGDDGVRVWAARSGRMLRRYMGGGAAWALLSPDCGRLVVGVWGGGDTMAAHTLPFGACGPVERMMALARARNVAAGARQRR
ncbi:MAG TPA: hypothetical protein VFS20_05785 [Longimicrobium sp.]|nr:hypothetical protein [Longimicrobium sp.]